MNITFRKSIEGTQLKNPFELPGSADILSAVLLAAVSRAGIPGLMPFGVAFFASVIRSETAYLGFAAISSAMLGSTAASGRYLAAAVIVWLVSVLRGEKKFYAAPVSAAAIFVCGVLGIIFGGQPAYAWAALAAECAVCFAACLIFNRAAAAFESACKHEDVSREGRISIVITLAVLIFGLSEIVLPFNIRLDMLVTIYMTLCVALCSETSAAVCFGIIAGFIATLESPEAILLVGIYGICALFAGLLKIFGKLGVSLGFIFGAAISLIYVGAAESIPLGISELFFASIAFAALPKHIHRKAGILLDGLFYTPADRRDFKIREYVSAELKGIAKTFSELADSFCTRVSPGTDAAMSGNVACMFDEVAERVCISCRRCSDCWQKSFNDMYRYMFDMLDTIEREGQCSLGNLPIVFSQKCINPEIFASEFNHVYEIHKQSSLHSGEMGSERRFMARQYTEISNMMRELSLEIDGGFYFLEDCEKKILSACRRSGICIKNVTVTETSSNAPEVYFTPTDSEDTEAVTEIASEVLSMPMQPSVSESDGTVRLSAQNRYKISIGIRQKTRDTESVCGDTVTYFMGENNKFYIIICDGMGSGREASQESQMTAELLAGFLRAGFSKSTAVNMINSTLALKMEREGFSTVDLAEIDLRTGRIEFIKIGGAESYLMIGRKFEAIASAGLPIGILEDVNPERIARTLSEGDTVVMVSDGISEIGYGTLRCEWIRKIMKGKFADTQELAERIMKNAERKVYPNASDDMSVVCIRLLREEKQAKQAD